MEINITTLPTFSLDLLKIQRVNIRSIISTSWRPHNEDSSTDTVFIKLTCKGIYLLADG